MGSPEGKTFWVHMCTRLVVLPTFSLSLCRIYKYMYTDIQKELASHIISDIKSMDDKLICAYQADEKDRDFYFDLGFTLYKDFAIQSPGKFNDGFDQTRFVLELR